MTTYAPTFTPRYRAKYRAGGLEHSVQIRGPRGASAISMTTRGNSLMAVFNDLSTRLADDFAWISADVALTDSDVWIPASTPGSVTGVIAVADMTIAQRITGTTFSGRAAGSKARLTLFGIQWVQATTTEAGNDFVVQGSEDGGVAAAVIECSGQFYANSGAGALFYNRATIKPNDHLVKLARRGIIS